MSTITIDTNVYQALLSRIEKLENVLYGEVKFKLTELETSLNSKPTTVKKVTKKAVDEAKSAAVLPTAANSELSNYTNDNDLKAVTSNNTDKPTTNPGQVKEAVKECSKDNTGVVYNKGMNIIEFFKSNYERYNAAISNIPILKEFIDEKLKDSKSKKNPADALRSALHHVWNTMRKPKDINEADQILIKQLLSSVEADHNKAKNGEKVGDSVSVQHKNTIELGGVITTVSDEELIARLSPEDEI